MHHRILILFLSLFICVGAVGQDFYDVTYRPENLRYELLNTEHFDLIFQSGTEQQAREAGHLLEDTYDEVRALVGLEHSFRMPVVLNAFNDLANGRVTALVFRQEVEAVSLKGKFLDPGFYTWMEAVLPHELVHAAHAEIRPVFGFGGLLSLFSPDLSRMLNFSIPPGMTEGVAIYHESRLHPGVGRLNFSFFNMKYRAAMTSGRPWRLAQMLEASAYSQPYNRHYIGGSFVYDYLVELYGEAFFGKSVSRYNRWPFFGYAFSLWTATGEHPWRIGRALRKKAGEIDVGDGYSGKGKLVSGRRGLNHYRPQWLSPNELVVYLDGYDVRRGFYTYDLRSGERKSISYQTITEDREFSLTPDRASILYSRYVPHWTSDVKAIADVHQVRVRSGVAERLTREGRLFSPVFLDEGRLWATQNRGQFTSWVSVANGQVDKRLNDAPRAVYRDIAICRLQEKAAILAGLEGRSVVFTADIKGGEAVRRTPVLFREQGSIYDISWSPGCRYLLFTSDPHGKPDIFAHDFSTGQTVRLTDAPYGAFEGSLSADGTTLAFIDYRHERRDLRLLPFEPESVEPVASATFDTGSAASWPAFSKRASVNLVDGKVRDYRPGFRSLRPRILVPSVSREKRVEDGAGVDLGWALGLKLEGSNPLESWAYGIHAFHQDGRLWGEAALQTAAYPWRPGVRIYGTPSSQLVRLVESGEEERTVRLARYERGIELTSRLPVTHKSNVFFTGSTVRLDTRLRQTRFMDRGTGLLDPFPAAGDFTTRATISPSYTMAYRLQSNPRDLVPNTGLILRTRAEVDVWTHKPGSAIAPFASRAWLGSLSLYLPLSLRWHQSLRLEAGLLSQNEGSIYDLDSWVPRGFENDLQPGKGTFLKGGIQYTTPLWYIDNGFVALPAYFKVLLAYGFVESVSDLQFEDHWTSAGIGIGLDMRVAHALSLTFRVAAAWQLETGKLVAVFR